MLIIIEEASRRIPQMVISADAQDEQYQLGGGSKKNTSQVCATSFYQDGFVLDSCKVGKNCVVQTIACYLTMRAPMGLFG